MIKSIAEILPLLREQVIQGIYDSLEEAVSEFKTIRERRQQ